MTLVKLWISIVLVSILSSGCAQKHKDTTVKYKFEKIEMTGTYVDMGSKEVQRMCSPKMRELSDTMLGVIEFYDWQIDEYDKAVEMANKMEEGAKDE